MTLREKINADLIVEMKAKNAAAVSTMRMLTSSIKSVEVDTRKVLDDADILDIVGKEMKKLKDGLDSFVAGGREDLAEGVRAEIAIIAKYLPAQLTDDELRAIIAAKKAAMGTVTEKDFGRLMGEVTKETKGRADGSKVQAFVKEAIAAVS